MSIASGIAVYFIVWWICLFAVLPFGVKNAHEAGDVVEQGNEAGAPVSLMLLKKVIATTLLSAVIFTMILGQMTYAWISFEDIPFLGGMPH